MVILLWVIRDFGYLRPRSNTIMVHTHDGGIPSVTLFFKGLWRMIRRYRPPVVIPVQKDSSGELIGKGVTLPRLMKHR